MMLSVNPNYQVFARDQLQDIFKKSLKQAQDVLKETQYLPYVVVMHKQVNNKNLILSVSFDKDHKMFFVNSDIILSNNSELDCEIESFIEKSITILNDYMETNRSILCKQVQFVIFDSSRFSNLKLNVPYRYSARSILNHLSQHQCSETSRSIFSAEGLSRETEFILQFKSDLDKLKNNLQTMSLCDFDEELLKSVGKYGGDNQSEAVKNEYQPIVFSSINDIGLVGNLLQPKYMGREFYGDNSVNEQRVKQFIRKKFEFLDPVVMFLAKRGVFTEIFNVEGELIIDYAKVWSRYRLDYLDLSLFGDALISVPAQLPEISVDMFMRPQAIHPSNESDMVDSEIFLFRYLIVDRYNKNSTVNSDSPL